MMDNDRLRRTATYASAAVAVILIIAKMTAYLLTDSVAMLSSLLDSTVDLIASSVTIFGVASALRPPDHDHRYGHGKAEPLAALAQAAFISGSSILLAYESIDRLYHQHTIENETLGYAVMALALILTALLLAYQHYVVRRTRSMAIDADQIHYAGDFLINLAVIAAFALYQWTDLAWFDPVFAMVIAAAMIVNAIRIATDALHVLMDRELSDDEREKIKVLVLAQNMVRGMHDLRSRTDGERLFIEFHLELDADMTVRAAHQVDEAIMHALKIEFPNADILIHQDPAGLDEERLDAKIAQGRG